MIEASEPPARKISASPNLIMRQDSPMALFEVAQAVTMHMFGPRNPNSIEIRPLAMLLMSIGMVKAETRDGPLLTRMVCWSSSVFSPPMPLLTITPKRSRFTFVEIDAGIVHRHFRRGHGKVRETIGPPHVLRILEKVFGSKSRTSPADPAIVGGGIEATRCDAMPLTPFLQLIPKGLEIVAHRRDDPIPVMTTLRSFMIGRKRRVNDRRLPVTHYRSLVTSLARAHPDALHGLEKFAFGLDGRRDDDFGLLKLGDVARADVAHAGGDRADQVLAAIVHFGRAEQNLFQRAGRADFDARAARQVGVRRGHSPMIAAARRFVRLGKRAADHDGVRAAGERFANIAAFAHSAVGDDRNIARGFLEIGIARRRAIDRGRDLRHAEAEDAARSAGRARARLRSERRPDRIP